MDPVEELKLLQSIIDRQAMIRVRIMTWLFGFLSGLTVAFWTNNIQISRFEYLASGLLLTFIFWWMIQSQHVISQLAIGRFADVEKLIREKQEYDGPRISETLVQAANSWFVFVNSITGSAHAMSLIPLIAIMLSITALALMKP